MPKQVILTALLFATSISAYAQDYTTTQDSAVEANFEMDKGDYFLKLTNTSKGAIFYKWTFLNADSAYGTQDTDKWPIIAEYNGKEPCSVEGPKVGDIPCTHRGLNFVNYKGKFYVCLEVTGDFEQKDTMCKSFVQNYISITVLPLNSITPNGDGTNDYFDIEIGAHTMYDLVIYNRWGVKVFESQDANYDWDGTMRDKNNVIDCPVGTYFWTLKYQLVGEAEQKEKIGTVTLIR